MRQKYLFFLISLWLLGYQLSYGQYTEEIVSATEEFLNTLNAEQQVLVQYQLQDSTRTKWTNFPVGMVSRPGLQFGSLSEESKIKFHQLLLTFLSSQGYLKTTSIMKLDDILNEGTALALERKQISQRTYKEIMSLEWDYDNFYISLWNVPDMIDPWGLKFEGHHLSINLTMASTEISMTPLFMGADPAEVTSTKFAGLRVLSKEEDYGIALINSMDSHQKEIATLSQEVPADIITNPQDNKRITEYYGISADQLTEVQQKLLVRLIKEYINNLEENKATEALRKLNRSGPENIFFAWIGSYERKQPHYYLIHSPDYIIEYDNVGFQNDGNHIHTIWREKKNDFGEDILRQHYKRHKH
ncbi:DUF3500 domain-containing protein [Poritiphilus flavus]|uniref:DUF3500 domain-containing protein n=1 Tax=Poritiphilus flavus TaxID=2697053 RepID=A0A6L9EBL5_9FLAO|nr:DUF3500 domain-containing protein [Poritiphilus flavus]NAS12002.1 DUF3500 domain-containing protein [Poritiphilus flavus]